MEVFMGWDTPKQRLSDSKGNAQHYPTAAGFNMHPHRTGRGKCFSGFPRIGCYQACPATCLQAFQFENKAAINLISTKMNFGNTLGS